MGKNVEIKHPDSPISDRQSYAIYSLTGIDVREIGMTKQQASDVIDLVNDGKAYHVRLQMADAGGRVARKDVHKNFRDHSKPRGYVTAMKKLTPEPKPEEKPKTKPKKKAKLQNGYGGPSGSALMSKLQTEAEEERQKNAKITGLEKVDFTNPDVIRVMEAFGLQKVAANG